MTTATGCYGVIGATITGSKGEPRSDLLSSVTDYPATTFMWVKRSGQIPSGRGFNFRALFNAGHLKLQVQSDETVRAQHVTTEGTENSTKSALTDLTWHFTAFSLHSSTDRDVWFDGSNVQNLTSTKTWRESDDFGLYIATGANLNAAMPGIMTSDLTGPQIGELQYWPEWTDGNKKFQLNTWRAYSNTTDWEDLSGTGHSPISSVPQMEHLSDGPPIHLMPGM